MAKRFTVISISILLTLLIGAPVLAQPGPGPEGGPGFGPPPPRSGMFGGPHPGMLLHGLDLTDSQHAAIREIMQNSRDDLRALMDTLRESQHSLELSMLDGAFDNGALAQVVSSQTALVEARAQLQYKIYSVLTDEQKAQLKTRLEERLQAGGTMSDTVRPRRRW